MLLFMLYPYTF